LSIFNLKYSQNFWKGLSFRAYLLFSAAVFFSFSIFGFVNDFFSNLALPVPIVILWSIYSGFTAIGYVYAFTRNLKALPLIIFLQVGFIFIHWNSIFYNTITMSQSHKLYFDGAGIFCAVILSYIFFIFFIRGEGIKQIQMRAEMDLAAGMHDVLVPTIQFKDEQLELYGKSNPTLEIGGDLIDFNKNKNHTTSYIADVSGHGIDAGLLMGMFKAVIHSQIQLDLPLTELINETNKTLYELKKRTMFVTCSIIRFYPNFVAEFTTAGHLPILHFRADLNLVVQLLIKQIPITTKKDYCFSSRFVRYSPGDIFVLLTDGLVEVMNKAGDEFGLTRIKQFITANSKENSQKIFELLFEKVNLYGKQADDQSAVIIKSIS
jgi:phosphoserine phosphatase RsbU/P